MSDIYKYDIKFWEELELRLNGTIPAFIKHVLKASGYENFICLRELTKDDLCEIESYVSNNLKLWIRKLRKVDDDYVGFKKTFEFLPGHKKLILKISEKLNSESGSITDPATGADTIGKPMPSCDGLQIESNDLPKNVPHVG